ncbi:hypothetical protein BGZ72_005091 [Mortierella alpina]|nr:hypothetical protein BGZ72_005091 [Mortierella alpina]
MRNTPCYVPVLGTGITTPCSILMCSKLSSTYPRSRHHHYQNTTSAYALFYSSTSPFPFLAPRRTALTLGLLRTFEAQNHRPQLLLRSAIAFEKDTLASRSAEKARARAAQAAKDATDAAKKAAASATGSIGLGVAAAAQPKTSLWLRVKKELIHYWDGTKLLGKEIKISTKLANRLLLGEKLTRREQKQLRRTTSDLLRLIPFSVFVIVPFMELLLPVALKLFPNMLPSTFEDKYAEEEKRRKLLKMRLEMAKFLQETIEESGIPGSEQAVAAKEFGDIFRKVRSSGEQASTEELIRVSKLFRDELTLDNLSRPQLVSMSRYMNLNAFGTDNFLRHLIRIKMNSIKRDDKLIMSEGVESLTTHELHAACQSRGICTGGVSEARLQSELAQWLELHLTYAIPSSLLILSRAFLFSDNPSSASIYPPEVSLQATLSSLPDNLLTEAELDVSEIEGAATAKQKLEVLEQQEELIAEEKAQEEMYRMLIQQHKHQVSIIGLLEPGNDLTPATTARDPPRPVATPPAPVPPTPPPLLPTDTPEYAMTIQGAAQVTASFERLTPLNDGAKQAMATHLDKEAKEEKSRLTKLQLLELREALYIMSSRSAVLEERDKLKDLKEDRLDYKADIEELAHSAHRQEHKASRRLGYRLEKMISKLDQELEAFEAAVGNTLQAFQTNERGEVTVADVEQALKVIRHAPAEENIKQIVRRLDIDGDGLVLLDHIVQLAEWVEQEEGHGVFLGELEIRRTGKGTEGHKHLRKEDILNDM